MVELHDFLRDWLTGALPRTEAAFARFKDALGAELVVISPRGTETGRAAIIDELEASHGAVQATDFEIWIENYRCRRVFGDLALVTYEEWHRLDDETSARLTTALYRRRDDAPAGVEWLHVHETWLPDQAPAEGERFPRAAGG